MKRFNFFIYVFIVTLIGWTTSNVYANEEYRANQLKVNLDTPFEKELTTFKKVLSRKDSLHKTQSSSINFLMGESLSKPSPSENIKNADFENFTIKPLKPAGIRKLISDNCSERKGSDGTITRCLKRYSDGSYTEKIDQNFKYPIEHKRQLIITEFDSGGERIHRKSIRHKKTYTMEGQLTAEHIDIVTRPYTGKILREFMIHNIDKKTGNTTKLIWTKYKQIEDQMLAEIAHHAVLNFDRTGKARDGRAEIWDGEKVVDTRLNVDTVRFPAIRVERTSWGQWENQIKNMIQQVQTL